MSDVDDLRRELRELRQRLDDAPTPILQSEGSLPEVTILKDPPTRTPNLKPNTFPVYDGDRATYPAWRKAVLSALRIDWLTFGYTNSRVFLMIYKALDGKAQRQAATYFESGGLGGLERPEDFIAFLDRGNWDQTRISRARSELNELRMGPRQKWSQFYCQWSNKLTEASGDSWPDGVKISLLRTAMNSTLKIALASNHLIPENDYTEYVRIVSKIAQQYEEITRISSSENRLNLARFEENKEIREAISHIEPKEAIRGWGRSGMEKGPVGGVDRSGDTFMGGINTAEVLRGPNGKRLRAKWKSPDQILRLKEEGRCYRCERKGCSTKICKILPAINPNIHKKNVKIANVEPLNPELFLEDDSEEEKVFDKILSEN